MPFTESCDIYQSRKVVTMTSVCYPTGTFFCFVKKMTSVHDSEFCLMSYLNMKFKLIFVRNFIVLILPNWKVRNMDPTFLTILWICRILILSILKASILIFLILSMVGPQLYCVFSAYVNIGPMFLYTGVTNTKYLLYQTSLF